MKLGGKSTNNIDVWDFADETEADQANKGLEEQTSNVYGNGHTSLYADVISLYRLDQVASSTKAEDLGPLPAGAVALLCTLSGCWLCIGIYVTLQKLKQKKTEKHGSNK